MTTEETQTWFAEFCRQEYVAVYRYVYAHTSHVEDARIRQWLLAESYRMRLASAMTFVLLLTIGLLSYLSFSPRVYTVSAEELLQRAIQGETERVRQLAEPVIYHKLQVRRLGVGASATAVTWESWHNTHRNEFRQRVAEPFGQGSPRADEQAVLAGLTAILQANHLDTQRPLSARAFAEWRTRIVPRSDQVTEIALPGQADLGEQLEVVREDNKQIVVRGLVQTATRKEELLQMLHRIPLVSSQILTIEEAVQQTQRTAAPHSNESVIATNDTAVTSAAAAATVNAFQQRLLEQLGGRKGMSEAEREAVNARVTQFYNVVEADASAAMAEVWALRRLQERFAVSSAADLDAISRQRLDEMLGNHVARLRQRVRSLQARLRPQLAALVNDVPTVASAADATQPAKIQAAFRAVEQVSRLTDQLIAGQSATSLPQTARALLVEFARLDAVLSDLEKK